MHIEVQTTKKKHSPLKRFGNSTEKRRNACMSEWVCDVMWNKTLESCMSCLSSEPRHCVWIERQTYITIHLIRPEWSPKNTTTHMRSCCRISALAGSIGNWRQHNAQKHTIEIVRAWILPNAHRIFVRFTFTAVSLALKRFPIKMCLDFSCAFGAFLPLFICRSDALTTFWQ